MLPLIELRTLSHSSSSTSSSSTSVNVARFNNDGAYAFTGGTDKLIKLWNPTTGLCIKTYTGHGWDVLGIDIAKDNTRFASVGGDRAVMLWDVGTGRIIRRFNGHAARVNAVAFNADCSVLVSASYDATVKCWDLKSQSAPPIQSLSDARDSVTAVVVTDSEIIASCVDGVIRTYDLRMGMLVTDDIGAPVTSIALSNDRNCLLASSLDNTVRLLDRENGELLAEYKGHKNTDYRVTSTLTNTDSHVISGSEDGHICFWDLVEGDLVKTIHPHSKLVNAVCYHPKDDVMISASKDGTAKVFSAR